MQIHFRLFAAALMCVSLTILPPSGAAGSDLLPGAVHDGMEAGSTELQETDQLVRLNIPLRSEHFASTPVALVNDEPITVGELAAALEPQDTSETIHGEEEVPDFRSALQRIIDSRLIVQEARNIGLDETRAVQAELEDFRIKTLLQELVNKHLEGMKPDPAEVEKMYRQLSREVLLSSLFFESGEEARRFLDEAGEGDFDRLARRFIEEGKAREEKGEQYVKIKDLRPQIGQQVYTMETGNVSTVFRSEEGFFLFQLTDSRFVEDEAVGEEAFRIVNEGFRKQQAMEYSTVLEEKYVSFDEELYEQLDFNRDFEQLKSDKRVLAVVQGEEPVTITVADLAARVDVSLFHGAEKAQQLQRLNRKRDLTISNMLFRITGEMEARHLGLDRTEEFIAKISEYERSILFREFMNRVILPDIEITAEEVRGYYDEHVDAYSSPAMLRLESLAFHNRGDAESALDKLRKGADFKWVSANSTGLVPPDTKGLLPFDEKLLSLTSLPADLQESVGKSQKGDSLLYAAPDSKYFYVLYLEDVFPSEPQPFEEARAAVSRKVYELKSKQLLDDWTGKLKEAYATRIFLADSEQ